MFTLAVTPAYWWPVVVNAPTDDGEVGTSQFDAQFKRLTQTEYDALVASLKGSAALGDVSIARSLVIGWRGVNDGQGQAITFTDGTLGQLLDIQGTATAIVRAYTGSLAKAAEKN